MEKNDMKTKTEQIEELKATAVKLQQQIDELEKPKQWEPTMDLDWLDYCNHINTYTRLLQYVKEFGGDWEANWKDHIHLNYYVQYSNHRRNGKWAVGIWNASVALFICQKNVQKGLETN
jgi:hypothetical protein